VLPRLYAIVDAEVCARAGYAPSAVAAAYLASGVRLLQLRAKDLESGDFLALTRGVVRDAHAAGARVIVNDRADVAVMAQADGVHVGQEDLSPADVRRIVGPELIVGLSTHTLEQVEAALMEPVTYIAVGPIFGTTTKATGYDAVGVALLEQAAARAGSMPVVAIGGITRRTVEQVWRAGAASAAVITDLLGDDPAARAAEFLAIERRLAIR
jgi:thiamine-phosphate pyrophosphorylase